jgi:hypothetical protein
MVRGNELLQVGVRKKQAEELVWALTAAADLAKMF